MSKTTVMGGASTSQVLAAWKAAVSEVTAEAQAKGINLSGKDKPVPKSNAKLVEAWRKAGSAVESSLSPKKKQRDALMRVMGSSNLEAAEEAARLLDEMDEQEANNGEA